jgi:hypothetical protein
VRAGLQDETPFGVSAVENGPDESKEKAMSDLRSALNEYANEFPFAGVNRAAAAPKVFTALREVFTELREILKAADQHDCATQAVNGDEQRLQAYAEVDKRIRTAIAKALED